MIFERASSPRIKKKIKLCFRRAHICQWNLCCSIYLPLPPSYPFQLTTNTKIGLQQINTDSHENLPKGKTKEEEDRAFLKVHCVCSYLSQADFIHTLKKALAGSYANSHREATPEATDLCFLSFMDTGEDQAFGFRLWIFLQWLVTGQVGESPMGPATTELFKL